MCVANELFAANNFAELLSQCLRNGSRTAALVTQHSQRFLARLGIKSSSQQDVLSVLDPERPRSRPDPRVCPVFQYEDQDEDKNTDGNEDGVNFDVMYSNRRLRIFSRFELEIL